jgi:rare lipoprotein A
MIVLSGCAMGSQHVQAQPQPLPTTGPAADYPVVIGQPFTIDGVTHTPVDRLNFDVVGYALEGVDGGTGVTAAHKTLPLPSYVEVTALDTGKTVLVRVERRGPMTNDRVIDLSPGAAAQLGLSGTSKAPVRVRRVNPPEAERALLRSGQRAPDRMDTPKPLAAVLMRKLDAEMGIVRPATLPDAPATPATPPVPAPVAKPAVPAKPAGPAVVTPPARPATPAVAATPRAAPASPARPAAAASGNVVQVAAFSTKDRADAAAARLGARVESAGRLWRVRMGPFSSPAEAQAALAKARSAGYSDARIQRAN